MTIRGKRRRSNGLRLRRHRTEISSPRQLLIAARTNTACLVANATSPCKMSRWNLMSERVANPPQTSSTHNGPRLLSHGNSVHNLQSARYRPWNAKIGIWLFLASEVMLFGGLFSAYIFLRIDAPPGRWPHGLLNVPVGTMNTAILIMSSVTVVLAWAALKMRRYRAYWWYMLATILCGLIFLFVKLYYEWPQKFEHYGIFIKPAALEKYEKYLG